MEKLNSTTETLPDGKARLIVYADPKDTTVKIVHDFCCMDMLEKHVEKATVGVSFDVVI